MLELSQAVVILEESVKALEDVIRQQNEIKDPIIQELARRSFVREFASLGERLIYFRGPDPERMSVQEIEGTRAQFEATRPLNEAVDIQGANLVKGFTSRRNRLLHQYLIDFHKGNNGTFTECLKYFTDNARALKEGVRLIREQNQDIYISKISYEFVPIEKSVSFQEDFQLQIEVAIKEIESLKKILAAYKIDINALIQDKNRKLEDFISNQFYNDSLTQPALLLHQLLDKAPFWRSAMENIFENTCLCLKMINNAYDLLRGQGEHEVLLTDVDTIYNDLELDENDALKFAMQAARYRLSTAHENESNPENVTQLIKDIMSLYILDENYLKLFLKVILDQGYERTLKTQLILASSKSTVEEPVMDLVTVDDREINLAYEYEETDINAILNALVQRNRMTLPNVEVLGAIDNIFPEQLADRLRDAQARYRGRTLLIPYNLGNYHWVGLLIELDASGQPTRAVCCDPLGTNKEALKSIDMYFKRIFPNNEISYVNYLRQTDSTSCGAITIDNLMMLAAKAPPIDLRLSKNDIVSIRVGHLEALQSQRPDIAEQFNRKQKENCPTVPSLANQLSYYQTLKNVKFSLTEAKLIAEAANLIERLEDQELKNLLKRALSYEESYKDNVKPHLNFIRDAINRALLANKSVSDQQTVTDLADIFIGVSEIVQIEVKDWSFRLHYQMLVAIGNLVNKQAFSPHSLKSQIEEDEQLARKLQQQEWLGAEKNKLSDTTSPTPDIPIPANRKGLAKVNIDEVKKLLGLPENLEIGTAVDDGGCFFDALAQRLNTMEASNRHTEEMLRHECHEFYIKNKAKVDQWNRKEYGGIDKGDEDYFFVQYTASQLKQSFGNRAPIWGRPTIEGRILCEHLNIPAIYLVELISNPVKENETIPVYSRVTKDGATQIDALPPYSENIPILVVGQNSQHYVSILPVASLKKGTLPPSAVSCKDDEPKKKEDPDKDEDQGHKRRASSMQLGESITGTEGAQKSEKRTVSSQDKSVNKGGHDQTKSQQTHDDSDKQQKRAINIADTFNSSVAKPKAWEKSSPLEVSPPDSKQTVTEHDQQKAQTVTKQIEEELKQKDSDVQQESIHMGRKF